jgi:hypothetical protein
MIQTSFAVRPIGTRHGKVVSGVFIPLRQNQPIKFSSIVKELKKENAEYVSFVGYDDKLNDEDDAIYQARIYSDCLSVIEFDIFCNSENCNT